jgi:hypothetical protein
MRCAVPPYVCCLRFCARLRTSAARANEVALEVVTFAG